MGCCLIAPRGQAEESHRSVQLYLYLSPSPKWGYIAEDSKPQSEVQFYECDVSQPILVNRSKLKKADGLCQSDRTNAPSGTWIVKYDPERKVFVAVDSDSEAPVVFTKEELFGRADAPEFADGAFGVAVEGKSKKAFRVEGKVQR
jgi:hypothetical protein